MERRTQALSGFSVSPLHSTPSLPRRLAPRSDFEGLGHWGQLNGAFQ